MAMAPEDVDLLLYVAKATINFQQHIVGAQSVRLLLVVVCGMHELNWRVCNRPGAVPIAQWGYDVSVSSKLLSVLCKARPVEF